MKHFLLRVFIATVMVYTTTGLVAEDNHELKIYKYDFETETEIQATVTEIREAHWYEAERSNLLATVELADKSKLTVDLGMQDLYETEIANGSQIKVLGSKLEIDGQPHMLARQVKLEDNTVIRVRNMRGVPFWLTGPGKQNMRRNFHYRMSRMRRR